MFSPWWKSVKPSAEQVLKLKHQGRNHRGLKRGDAGWLSGGAHWDEGSSRGSVTLNFI